MLLLLHLMFTTGSARAWIFKEVERAAIKNFQKKPKVTGKRLKRIADCVAALRFCT